MMFLYLEGGGGNRPSFNFKNHEEKSHQSDIHHHSKTL